MILRFRNSFIAYILNQNDWIPSKLVNHKKKVIEVKIGFVEINFIVGDRGELRLIENPEHADTMIQMSFDAFFKTIILKEKKGIKIDGDIDFAKDFSEILNHIEWDLEDDFSLFFGDIVGHEIAQAGKSFIYQSKKNLKEVSAALVEFWQEENKILSRKEDVNDFIKDVDCLSEEADRIEARLEKLIQRKSI